MGMGSVKRAIQVLPKLRLPKKSAVMGAIFFLSFFFVDTGRIEAVTSTNGSGNGSGSGSGGIRTVKKVEKTREEMRIRIPNEPTSLNPVDGANWSAGEVHAQILESLLIQDPETLAWRGRLAPP